ncbi:MAG TPA: zf-TFIIB domain-containing protein [Candidatus Binatia bacterium]
MRKERAEVVRCPQCEVPMKPVSVRANPGSLIELDQCGQCGGIWCDKWELFPIQADEAARLEPADEKLLRLPLVLQKEIFCPRCTARMSAINEPSLGADVQFRRCFKCDGIWLKRGQFTRYKNHQEKVRSKNIGAKTTGKKLPETDGDEKSWVVTGTKGMFAYPPSEETIEAGSDSLTNIVETVLQKLLQMVSRT